MDQSQQKQQQQHIPKTVLIIFLFDLLLIGC